jgi:hypothetical protein
MDTIAAWKDLILPTVHDPVRFVKDIIGATPDPWQEEAMRGLVEHKKAAIAGCNGSGKDCLSTWIALWMLCTRPFCKGQVTGPSKSQVFDTVWPEAKRWIDHSKILPHLLVWSKTRIAWKEYPDRWFIAARTAAKRYSHGVGDSAVEGIQGMHGPHIIIILTESSGVDDPNWDSAESCCTMSDNLILAVGNPLRREGRLNWYKRNVSYTECTHVDPSVMEGWIERYGRDSAFVQIRCFGRFPSAGSPDAALPWDVVHRAMTSDREHLTTGNNTDIHLGVDCARFGDDEFAIAPRVGNRILPLRILPKSSGPEMVRAIDRCATELAGKGKLGITITIDDGGLGGTVLDDVRELGYVNVHGVVGRKPRDEDAYEAWDDEAWMETLLNWLMSGGILPYDDVLLAQLTSRKYEFTRRNEHQRRLESKKSMRRRGLKSPDRAESVLFAVSPVSEGSLLVSDDTLMKQDRWSGPGDPVPAMYDEDDAEYTGTFSSRWR